MLHKHGKPNLVNDHEFYNPNDCYKTNAIENTLCVLGNSQNEKEREIGWESLGPLSDSQNAKEGKIT